MPTVDLVKDNKDLYTATTAIGEVRSGPAVYLAVDGKGAPGGDVFQAAVGQLYGVAYTMKFMLKGDGRDDYKVPPFECVYQSDPCATPMDEWQWRLLLRMPDAITAADVTAAQAAFKEKRGVDARQVKRLHWKEGRCVQVLHVGPYDQIGATYDRLFEYMNANALAVHGPAHEIYLNDPGRTAPENLKTVVRMGVK